MGRVLTIRLIASTYNEEEAWRSWPTLCALAWPDQGRIFGGGWKPNPASFPSPVKADSVRRGVVELARGLLEESRFGNWDDNRKNLMRAGLRDLGNSLADLENALADWQPQAANKASDAIEDSLDSLESLVA